MLKYFCSNCGHIENRCSHNSLYVLKGLECPKCKKWTFIQIQEEAFNTIKINKQLG